MGRIKYLKCRFCPIITGSIEVPSSLSHIPLEEITAEDLGLVDIRCTECEGTHGRIKEMRINYEKNVPNHSNEEFKELLVDSGFSKQNFDSKVSSKESEKGEYLRENTPLRSGVNN